MTKYVIKSNDFHSQPYSSNIGVPQGDPISPILFNLFISDLPSYLGHTGVTLNDTIIPYIQYADDLCVIGESPEDLQHGLNGLAVYCKDNHIDINVSKTKIQVFYKGRPQNLQAYLLSTFLYPMYSSSLISLFSPPSLTAFQCGTIVALLHHYKLLMPHLPNILNATFKSLNTPTIV